MTESSPTPINFRKGVFMNNLVFLRNVLSTIDKKIDQVIVLKEDEYRLYEPGEQVTSLRDSYFASFN